MKLISTEFADMQAEKQRVIAIASLIEKNHQQFARQTNRMNHSQFACPVDAPLATSRNRCRLFRGRKSLMDS